MDGVLVINEIIDMTRRENRGCMILKVDFEKYYDSISWNFMRYVMKNMGFGEKWKKWLEASVFSSTMSIIVNGSIIKDFKVERGLRKGDPLSPFIFVLATEVLTRLTYKALEIGEFHGFRFNAYEEVSIMQHADDTILAADGNSDNLWSMKTILRGFEVVSGLKVNFHKSKLYEIGVGDWLM
ncbi:uncharacterized mitochondrial protein AtMg01250-like [Vicia villosa]|uniref:uncharacterized mitochondrial protein AtMg01250-like n=1 Tax=Vicia villosa TaxID=3911 RepID=UPI00273C55BB|nr:uncharacterized mitochondrial protein AtMg01250-like [Vicia villosa]